MENNLEVVVDLEIGKRTSKLYHIVSEDGTDYFVPGDDLKQAYDRFRAWERKYIWDETEEEIEEPQAIIPAGTLIMPGNFDILILNPSQTFSN